ncbi:MAG: phosphatase PAP2 family protein, partial [Desulfobulbaceae bacterium]|nr:phosphatase PAP2 family protein [Desulfobulbaceae bacterium]
RSPATNRYVWTAIGAGVLLLTVSWIIALADPIPAWEEELFREVNDSPTWVSSVGWPLMQAGSLAGPVIIAVVVSVIWRSARLTAAVLAAGLLAWFVAKAVKRLVERGRPRYYIAETVIREGDGSGLGFVSGHTAVAFALATIVAPFLPPWGRVATFAAAAVVGVARVTHGVHLPIDILGGAGVGLLTGAAVHLAWRAIDRRSQRSGRV